MKEPSNLLASVIMDLKIREEKGLATYGTTMDRKDLSKQEWLQIKHWINNIILIL